MFDLAHMPGKQARRLFAGAAVLLLIAQSAVVGTSAWCMDAQPTDDAEVAVQTAHADGHEAHMASGSSDEEHSHHGSDAESACPMMALCTLSAPSPFGGFTQTAVIVLESPETTGWSLHGDVPSHTPPPPRV